ncbi:tetratricopeptide repeat protein [Chryseobacterium oleae]|nr:tetratricopeptide repeat protein [Chryseobacterium oleae]
MIIKTSAQINKQQLIDNWAIVKYSTLDGSRDLSQDSGHFSIWKLSDNKICEYVNPIFEERKTCYDIKIENKSIRTSPKTFYEIEKLTNDTLIIIERLDGITGNDKIKKKWFVRTSKLQNEYLSTLKNDTAVVASAYFTPTLKKDIFFDVLERSVTNNDRNLSVKGNIIIYPKKQKINFQFESNDQSKKNSENIDFLKSIVEKSYQFWNLTGFEKYDQIILPYHIETQIRNNDGSKSSSMSFNFFKNDRKDLDKYQNRAIVIIENKKLAAEAYNKAMEALDKKKLDRAIELFNKAFDLNNTNVDALYNAASISLDKKDMPTACTALKKLKDFEQVEGTKLFNELCLKN